MVKNTPSESFVYSIFVTWFYRKTFVKFCRFRQNLTNLRKDNEEWLQV